VLYKHVTVRLHKCALPSFCFNTNLDAQLQENREKVSQVPNEILSTTENATLETGMATLKTDVKRHLLCNPDTPINEPPSKKRKICTNCNEVSGTPLPVAEKFRSFFGPR
jgi:hypothetical protein